MKILVLSFYYEPDLCAGSFRCTALVNELKRQVPSDACIDIVSTLPNRYQSFNATASEFEQTAGINIKRIKLPTHKSGMLDQTKAFYFFYKGALNYVNSKEYDLVVATSSRLFTAYLGARIANRKNAALYLDIRDIFVDTLSDILSPTISFCLLPLLKIIERYTIKSSTKLNLVSKGFEHYFSQKYKGLHLRFFTNGIDAEFLLCNQAQGSRRASGDKKTLLYAGNIGEGQGLDIIIPALAKGLGDDYIVKIVGDGGRKQQLVNALQAGNVTNVEFLAPVNRQELIEHYLDSDILFLHLNDYPAFRKVLPSKIFEYAAFDKPILAGVAGYAEKFIKEEVDNALTFYPGDAETAIAQLHKLQLRTPPRTDFIQKYARKSIMQKMVVDILSTRKEQS